MDTLKLTSHGVLLGTLHLKDFDQPWTYARLEPTPAFEKLRGLFEPPQSFRKLHGELAVSSWTLGVNREKIDALDLVLWNHRGDQYGLWMMHVDGDHARWRMGYSRELKREREQSEAPADPPDRSR